MISTISAAIIGLIVGNILDLVNNFTGFAIIFSVVSLFGLSDILCFIWINHPPMKTTSEKTPFFKLILEPFKDRNYMRFITFVSIWNFGANCAGPFFNVYMLENLRMSYLSIVLFSQIGGNLVTILFIRFWGKLVDRYGNKPIMIICCTAVFSLPFLWFFTTPENYWMALVINLLSGFFWPGFDMTNLNQSVWLAPEKNRSMYIAVYTLLTSLVGIAAAYIFGGLLMEFFRPILRGMNIPFVMGQKLNSFHVLFAVSGFIRLIALVFFSRRYEEANSKSTIFLIKNAIKKSKLKFNIS